MAKYYILKNKAPVPSTLIEMNHWFRENRAEVGYNNVGGVGVRTAFIGVDQAFGNEGPLVFETRTDGQVPFKTKFWASWDMALAGHHKAVDEVRRLLETPAR